MVMLHGRGASARDILSLASQLELPGWFYVAPQAANDTWYPNRFNAPIVTNEPWLSSALDVVGEVLNRVAADGITAERTIILGFSQGACLGLEFAARNARRYGGLVGLSGALIGPDDMRRELSGSLEGTPVFLGCDEHDPHVPAHRVVQSAETLERLGGDVTMTLYPDLGHSVSWEELDQVRKMMRLVPKAGTAGR
jgi:predicted esterase